MDPTLAQILTRLVEVETALQRAQKENEMLRKDLAEKEAGADEEPGETKQKKDGRE